VVGRRVALRADGGEPLVHRRLAPPAVVELVPLPLRLLGVRDGRLVGRQPHPEEPAEDVQPAAVLDREQGLVVLVQGVQVGDAAVGLGPDVGRGAGGDDELAEPFGLFLDGGAGHVAPSERGRPAARRARRSRITGRPPQPRSNSLKLPPLCHRPTTSAGVKQHSPTAIN
jgi:hypothetical protein